MILDPVLADNDKTLILYVGHVQPRTPDALLSALIRALESEALDPAHADSLRDPVVLALPAKHALAEWNGARVYQGNFDNLSLVFRLYTKCPTAIGILDALIARNLASPAFARAAERVATERMNRLASVRGFDSFVREVL